MPLMPRETPSRPKPTASAAPSCSVRSASAAVIGLTRTAAVELGPRRIRVNAVCPTSVNTPMAHAEGGEPQLRMEYKAVPPGRIAEPEEIAAAIHFLVAPDCNFINGQAIAVDGGFTAGLSINAYNTLAAE